MSIHNIISKVQDAQTFVQAENSVAVDITAGNAQGNGCSSIALQVSATVSTPAAKAFASGVAAVKTITFPAKAASTGGDYFVVYDTLGQGWAAALNKSGSDPVPSGAVYTAIPAGRKVNVDISGGTDAASVAALVETAFDALTGAGAAFVTDDSAANGTMLFTCVESGTVTAAERHNANDSGNGSIGVAQTTAGVQGDVNVASNLITETAHGFLTGLKGQMTTSSALPGGLAGTTDYFVIKVSVDTYKLASSLVNANAGTAIDLTSIGVGNQTFTPVAIAGATATMMKSIDGTNYVAEGSPVNITTTAVLTPFEKLDPVLKYYRIAYAITAGQLTTEVTVFGKGPV